jgi:tRNA modification GTPase
MNSGSNSPIADDTIFALSSGRLPAAIAVVRISGIKARVGLEMFGVAVPEPRRAARARLLDPDSRETIDDALAIWFPGPRSETGEDVVELHLHGGRAIVAKVFAVLSSVSGLRPAVAGEFTRRALLNGKLDLSGVEGLGDLIGAATERQRRQAMRQFEGGLSREVERWRDILIDATALTEAGLDFSDEADVPAELTVPAVARLQTLLLEIEQAIADSARGERLREGFVVAIAGPPNAGKSTLLNALAKRDVAIVSDIPGTTRDAIEVALDLDGVPVVLIDTAGIRETADAVEREGVARARLRIEAADLVLWLSADDDSIELPAASGEVWKVRTQIDLRPAAQGELGISAKTGEGLAEFLAKLTTAAAALAGEPALVTHARQRDAIAEAADHIRAALAIGASNRDELFAEELRLAARALGCVTGRVDVEELLDRIFSSFCIGK